jgi:hypothetical protein
LKNRRQGQSESTWLGYVHFLSSTKENSNLQYDLIGKLLFHI